MNFKSVSLLIGVLFLACGEDVRRECNYEPGECDEGTVCSYGFCTESDGGIPPREICVEVKPGCQIVGIIGTEADPSTGEPIPAQSQPLDPQAFCFDRDRESVLMNVRDSAGAWAISVTSPNEEGHQCPNKERNNVRVFHDCFVNLPQGGLYWQGFEHHCASGEPRQMAWLWRARQPDE